MLATKHPLIDAPGRSPSASTASKRETKDLLFRRSRMADSSLRRTAPGVG
jgi:hypothetical protein